MIGNDIVDLALAQIESNWQRKGFLDKIFTKQEQLQIHAAQNPTTMVWNLWSRKEAAYKIHNRQTGIRKFNPIQFECLALETEKVVFENQIYYTRTEISSEFIYSEAVTSMEDFYKIQPIKRPQEIQKKEGVPGFFDTIDGLIKPLSITHHGRFERVIIF
jgi:phosphopantetheinyl transferase (holo-ACP synthase)